MKFENIIIEKINHLGVIKINRLDQKNSLDIKTSNELLKGLLEIQKDKNIKCIAITGDEKFFSPGAGLPPGDFRRQWRHLGGPIPNCPLM